VSAPQCCAMVISTVLLTSTVLVPTHLVVCLLHLLGWIVLVACACLTSVNPHVAVRRCGGVAASRQHFIYRISQCHCFEFVAQLSNRQHRRPSRSREAADLVRPTATVFCRVSASGACRILSSNFLSCNVARLDSATNLAEGIFQVLAVRLTHLAHTSSLMIAGSWPRGVAQDWQSRC
jgi:hypothetical protein